MTLTSAAQKILEGAQSGVLDNIDAPIQELHSLLTKPYIREDLSTALKILNDARNAAYAHRRHIAMNLQQLEQSATYTTSQPKAQVSWQLSG